MKIIFTFFFTITSFLVFSQKQLSVDFDNQSLQEVLQIIEKDYQIVFSYTSEVVGNQLVTVQFENLEIENALTKILKNTTVDFEIINDTYVILKRKEITIPEISICGSVLDENEELLWGANIFIKKNGVGTISDERGRFQWKGKISPKDTVVISFVGYEKYQIPAKNLSDCPNITLQLQSIFFEDFKIIEYITSGIEQAEDLSHVILRPSRIDVVPGLTEADVLQMVQILPGVQSQDESATGLHIRGGTPDQNLILWDGIPIYNSGHFFGMLSAFNPYIVDNVKVYRGGFGAEYGGRVAGVVDINSQNKIPNKVKANVGINFTHSDASVIVPMFNRKSALLFSARRAYTDVIETPTYQKLSSRVFQKGKIKDQMSIVNGGDDILDIDLNFVFNDLNVKWILEPNGKNHFAISTFGIFDKLEFFSQNFDEELTEVDDLDLDNVGWSGIWKRKWNSKFSSQAKIAYTDFRSDYKFTLGQLDSADLELERAQVNEVEDWTFQIHNDWEISKKLKANFGYQLSNLKVQSQFKWLAEEEVNIIGDRINVQTAYMTLKPNLNKQWKVDVGLRYNFDSENKVSLWEPRFSLFYLPTKDWQFKFSSGIYQQYVSQVVELNDLGFNEQLWVLPDGDDLPIIKNRSLALGALFRRSSFQLEVEGYMKKLEDLTSASPAFVNSNAVQEVFQIGKGEVMGLDVLIKKRWANYQTWLSYTWNRIQYQFDYINEGQTFSAPHERPHSLTSVHMLRYKNWQFSASWKFASGKVYTESEGIEFEDDDVFPQYPDQGINAARLPNYHRLDASILYNISPMNPRMQCTVGLSFLNLYNRRNLLSRQYSVDENEDEEWGLIVLDRPLLGFTPNMVFRWAWK